MIKPISKHDRVQLFKTQDRLTTNYNRQIELLSELRRGLIHEWAKEDGMDFKTVTHTSFLGFLRVYFRAVEEGDEWFLWEDKQVLTDYGKYLDEYLTPLLWKTAPMGWAAKVGQMRRDHLARMKVKGKT